jgi:predicted transcriptional regulator
MTDDVWEGIGFIRASKHREPILRALEDAGPLTPTEIASMTNLQTRTVSTYLSGSQGLNDKGFIKCLNEEAKKGRLYQVTDYGKSVLSKLDDVYD